MPTTIYGAQRATGLIDSALAFDGLDDYAQAADATSLHLNDMTIELWYYIATPTGGAGAARFLCWKGEYWNTDTWGLRNSAADPDWFMFITRVGAAAHKNINIDTGLTGWVHIAATKQGTAGKLYINAGDPVEGVLDKDTEDCLEPIRLSHPTRIIAGRLDEVRLYNRALSHDQIKNHYERRYP